MSTWYYYDNDGNKQGPVSGGQLKGLAKTGKITPGTMVENIAGKAAPARKMKGLTFVSAEQPLANSKLPAEEYQFQIKAPPIVAQVNPENAVSAPLPVSDLFCTNCGNRVSEQAVACISCGAKPIGHRKFCRHCAATLNPEQVVCVKCGGALDAYATNNLFKIPSFFQLGVGRIVVLVAIFLMLFSFCLKWSFWYYSANIFTGEMYYNIQGGNGFQKGTFLFGIFFVYPTWFVMSRISRRKFIHFGLAVLSVLFGLYFGINYLYYLRSFSSSLGSSSRLDVHLIECPGVCLYLFSCVLMILGLILQQGFRKSD